MAVYLVQETVTRKELYKAYREKRKAKSTYKIIKKLPDDAIDYEPLAIAIAESESFKKYLNEEQKKHEAYKQSEKTDIATEKIYCKTTSYSETLVGH